LSFKVRLFSSEVPKVDFGKTVVCEVFIVGVKIATSFRVEQPDHTSTLDELIVLILVEVPVDDDLEL